MLYWLAIRTEFIYILANINNINVSFLSLVLEIYNFHVFFSELCESIGVIGKIIYFL